MLVAIPENWGAYRIEQMEHELIVILQLAPDLLVLPPSPYPYTLHDSPYTIYDPTPPVPETPRAPDPPTTIASWNSKRCWNTY